jgi:hypothetical protein
MRGVEWGGSTARGSQVQQVTHTVHGILKNGVADSAKIERLLAKFGEAPGPHPSTTLRYSVPAAMLPAARARSERASIGHLDLPDQATRAPLHLGIAILLRSRAQGRQRVLAHRAQRLLGLLPLAERLAAELSNAGIHALVLGRSGRLLRRRRIALGLLRTKVDAACGCGDQGGSDQDSGDRTNAKVHDGAGSLLETVGAAPTRAVAEYSHHNRRRRDQRFSPGPTVTSSCAFASRGGIGAISSSSVRNASRPESPCVGNAPMRGETACSGASRHHTSCPSDCSSAPAAPPSYGPPAPAQARQRWA